MEYISTGETAKKWDVSERRIVQLCLDARIDGAKKVGRTWVIPNDIEKPNDARVKSGKYIKRAPHIIRSIEQMIKRRLCHVCNKL